MQRKAWAWYKVFPAHAGMIRLAQSASRMAGVFPAHAGMIRRSRAFAVGSHRVPRPRGDDPAPLVIFP